MPEPDGVPPEDLARARGILREMDRLERRKRSPRIRSCLPWAIAILLALVIFVVISVNWRGFSGLWQRLSSPDSLPGIAP